MKFPIYNCVVDENDSLSGIYAVSFVSDPAVEIDFIKLSKEQIELKKDEKKQILTGVVLRPEQLIYREDENKNGYYIKFSADEIEKISNKMMKTGVVLKNTTHEHEKELDGNYLTETWIIEDPDNDKSKALGFEELEKGTLMASYKITDSDYWKNEIMSENVKGFSLEGFFEQIKLEKQIKKLNKNNMRNKDKKKSVLEKFVKYFLEDETEEKTDSIEEIKKKDKTDSGEAVMIFQLYDSSELIVDEDGYTTMWGMQMYEGEHKLYDGNLIVIDKDGNFVETKTATDEETKEVEPKVDDKLKKQVEARKQEIKIKQNKFNKMSTEDKVKKTKLEDEEEVVEQVETIEDKLAKLEERVAELESKLADTEKEVEEKEEELNKLKKKVPTTTPIVAKVEEVDVTKMNRTERIAFQLSNLQKARNKK
ncbi:hypothetical protein EZS27_008662 [termite gut metagenome]|uniref:Phage-like element PBSX protein XkdF domain-containing protein n=1 Tax=termite gut metagenome TaxID=433724 RepID=A0A5J4SCC4_9ZZZZ